MSNEITINSVPRQIKQAVCLNSNNVAVGGVVNVAGESGQLLDTRPTDQLRFYQVRDVP
jgi:hypothetical protein